MNFLPKDKMTQTALLLVVGLVLIVIVKSMEKKMKPMHVNVAIGVIFVGTLYLVYHVNSREEFFNEEEEEDDSTVSVVESEDVEAEDVEALPMPEEEEEEQVSDEPDVSAMNPVAMSKQEAPVPTGQQTQPEIPEACINKPTLESGDLLPKGDSNWADFAVPGMDNKNFLDAGMHVGVDTVGQSLRNATDN